MNFNPPYLSTQILDAFISDSLQEDIGTGDHTSLASIPENTVGKAQLIIKDNGILAGVALAERIFQAYDSSLEMVKLINDGEAVQYGEIAFTISGKVRSILATERLVLNCMQRMSGIATTTRQFVNETKDTRARILDTRKTTPGFRAVEKWAVLIGGGSNHRFGLYDMILLKDNHVDFAGGIKQAIRKTQDYISQNGLKIGIEIETRNLQEVHEALEVGNIDRIMLDNMNIEMMKEAVALINGKFETEASGGVTLQTVSAIAKTGVDYISVGGLTHSAKSLDLSLKAIK